MIKKKIDSRHQVIDMDKCVEQAGNYRFDLVLIASERLRELRKQNKHSDKYITPIDALLDVQNGLVDPITYMAKVDTTNQIIGR